MYFDVVLQPFPVCHTSLKEWWFGYDSQESIIFDVVNIQEALGLPRFLQHPSNPHRHRR